MEEGCSLTSWSLDGVVDFLWQGSVAAKWRSGNRIPAITHGSSWQCSRDEDWTARAKTYGSAEQPGTRGAGVRKHHGKLWCIHAERERNGQLWSLIGELKMWKVEALPVREEMAGH
jgi:hypothetical protein